MTTKPTITIDKNVPIQKRYVPGKWQVILRAMKKGDSFGVEKAEERNSVIRSANNAGVKITTRKLNGSGYRIWRVR